MSISKDIIKQCLISNPVSDECRNVAAREYGGGGTIQTIQQGECVLSECR